MNKKHFIVAFFAVFGTVFGANAQAQMKVGNNPTTINANSVLEIETTNKGMLLPRVALTATNNVAPLTAHVAGMVVYNTATAGSGVTAVTPGYYYNDGAQWVRLAAGGNGGNVSLPVTNLVSNNSPAGNTVGQLLYNTNPNIGLPVGPVYWDGTTWVAINPAASANLYNSDGTLTGARTLTQGANALTFDGAGNFIKMGGNVGIGTTTPVTKLDVNGSILNGGFDFFLGSNDQVARGNSGISRALVKDAGSVLSVNFAGDFTGGTRIGSLYSQASGSGNVGIGTTNPFYKLDSRGPIVSGLGAGGEYQGLRVVNDNVNFGSSAGIGMYVANYDKANPGTTESGTLMGGIRTEWRNGTDAAMVFSLSPTNSTTADAKMSIVNNGNVGIGTANPAAKLDVQGLGTGTTARFVSAGAAGEKTELIIGGGNPNWGQITYQNINNSDDARLSMGALGAEHLTIDVAGSGYGNVGIGRPSPLHRLHVDAGKLAVGASAPGTWSTNGSDILLNTGVANSQILLRPNGDGSNINQFLIAGDGHSFYGSDGLEKVRINQLGNVGIGTPTPAAKLDVNGNILNGGSDFFLGSNDQVTRGNSGISRALVKDVGSVLSVNFAGDFTGGTRIGSLYSQASGFGNVGIGTTAPAAKLDVNGYIKLGSSDGLGDITPEPGMIRFSNTTNKFQGYVGGSTNAWVDLN